MANKVVYNSDFGGFGLSELAKEYLLRNYGLTEADINKLPRHDPRLVRCVEALGEQANDDYSKIVVKELKGNRYRIDEYDGWESVVEPDDIEWITINED